MGSKLGALYEDFQSRCACKVNSRDFDSILREETQDPLMKGLSESKKLDIAYERLVEAFQGAGGEPEDWAEAAHLVATYRPIGLYGMMLRWQHNGGSMHANTQWTRAYINKLPDSAFLYIESGGYKDEQGRTTPKSLRHWPYKNHLGKVDVPHVRDALSRIPQTNVGESVQRHATELAQNILERHGGYR